MLHKPSVQRIADGRVLGSGLVKLFEQLVEEAIDYGEDVMDLAVYYIDEGDNFIPGTYVPELHLTVRRVK